MGKQGGCAVRVGKHAEEPMSPWKGYLTPFFLLHGNESQKGLLSPWPLPEPGKYLEWLNRSQPKEDVEKIRHAIKRSKPYGSEGWVSKVVAQFGLENTLRNPCRPGKGEKMYFEERGVGTMVGEYVTFVGW